MSRGMPRPLLIPRARRLKGRIPGGDKPCPILMVLTSHNHRFAERRRGCTQEDFAYPYYIFSVRGWSCFDHLPGRWYGHRSRRVVVRYTSLHQAAYVASDHVTRKSARRHSSNYAKSLPKIFQGPITPVQARCFITHNLPFAQWTLALAERCRAPLLRRRGDVLLLI